MPPSWDSDNRPWLVQQLIGLEETIYLGIVLLTFSWISRTLSGDVLNWCFLTPVLVSWLIEYRHVNRERSLVLRWLRRLIPVAYYAMCIAAYLYALKNTPGFVSSVILGMLLFAGIVAAFTFRQGSCYRRILSLTIYFVTVVGWAFFYGHFISAAFPAFDIAFLLIPLINATLRLISGMGLLFWQPITTIRYQIHLPDIKFQQLLSWLLID